MPRQVKYKVTTGYLSVKDLSPKGKEVLLMEAINRIQKRLMSDGAVGINVRQYESTSDLDPNEKDTITIGVGYVDEKSPATQIILESQVD
jgi:hypothetical protein